MRHFVLTVAVVSLFATAAVAQNGDRPAQQGPQNPAVKSMDQNNSNAPVVGANSFTMGEAKSRIEAKGYTNVTELKKDQNGVWRAMASLNGKSGPVSVDYQGNVN